jgi:DNA-binding beta-propeller fold protein YncE
MMKLIVIAVLVGLAGCAGVEPIRGRLHYGSTDAPEGERLLWPAAPEVPRFLYTGTLTGEPNFRPLEGGERSALARAARWLVGLDEAPASPLVLQRPTALAGDDNGRLYVSDVSRQAVFVFDEAAGELLLWDQAERGRRFVAPAGIATSGELVYVADADRAAVFVLDRRGEPRAVIGRGQLVRPTGVAFDAASSQLFVADTYAHEIKVFATDGRLLRTIGGRGNAPGSFNYPTYLALARDELVVTDAMNNRIQVFGAADGVFRRQFGARGLVLGNLVRPKGVSVDGEGNVYVIESYYDSLLVFSPRGEFLMPIGGTGKATGRFYLPSGVWVDAKNRVHVADMFNGRVVLFQFLGGG